ncbi:hypothetical protein GBZ48_01910 [Azospirillum melinis]|uniref:Uncharacterized protein n=1 Tax=Azospirillum melinis TaxID=328839 RepID=A0ABX2K5S5_9PROT|nr:hypothetical protein [Azospirillum melinis]MBP2306610.1 hypothetical protein [Azospirillum melinis]NUA98032.1 hypothetical protein [Azospirillum melinis]
MQGKSPHALLDRGMPAPALVEDWDPQSPADPRHETFPSPRAVLGEAAVTIAVFLLIAFALQVLALWIGA